MNHTSTFAAANEALDFAERTWRKDDDVKVTVFLQIFADAATSLAAAGVDVKTIATRCKVGPRGARRSYTGPDVIARVDWFLGTLYSHDATLGDTLPAIPGKTWFESAARA